MILVISPCGSGVGVARHIRKVARKNVLLFAPMYQEEQVAGVPNIAGGKSTAAAFNDLYKLVQSRKFDYIVIDMIEELKRPVLFGGVAIKTYGHLAEILYEMGHRGIGIFPYGRAMENLEFHRQDGADMAAAVGLNVPETHRFTRLTDGLQFLQAAENRQRCWVFKPNDNLFATYVPDNNDELIFHMTTLMKMAGDNLDFVLQEKIDGVEVDIEGWFCEGQYVQGTANITLETKTFMTGNLGLPVGCATTVQKAVSEESYLFRKAIMPYFSLLSRWKYTGAFSTTVIVDDKRRIWYLENCVRMGWDAFLAFMELFEGTAHDFFLSVLSNTPVQLKSGWGYGVRISIPPYPLEGRTPEEKEALRILSRTYTQYTYAYGEKRISQYGRVWWGDVTETDIKIGDEPVFKVIGTEPAVITTYHETSPFKAEKLAIRALDKLVLPNLQARVGDGAYTAYQRFMSLIDRNIVVTEERKHRRALTEDIGGLLGDELTASD